MTQEQKSSPVEAKATSKREELVEIYARDIVAKLEGGTIITHVEIAHGIGIPYRKGEMINPNYNSWTGKLKRKLKTNYGKFLTSYRGVGYVVAKPGEEKEVCKSTIRKGTNQVVKGISDMQYIRVEEIKDEKKRNETIETSNKGAALLGLLNQSALIEA